jgi:hypothetical protein
MLPQGEDLIHLCSIPDTTTLVQRSSSSSGGGGGGGDGGKQQQQQLLRPSPVMHLRLLIRIVLQHGKLLQPKVPPALASALNRKAGLGFTPSSGFTSPSGFTSSPAAAAAAEGGLDAVWLGELSPAVVGVVSGNSLAVRSSEEDQVAYPVVVVQQAFSRVFGFEPPTNFLGVENFKQLIQVRGGLGMC